MFALALEQGILAVMQNHVYAFNNKIYKQADGGPIGLELSGALGSAFMLLWDRKFLSTLEKAARNIKWDLYFMMRYVDDSNSVTDVMPAGARFENGRIRIKPEHVDEDLQIKPDLRTAQVVKQVANSIFPFIKMQVDCPSMNDNNLVPILDLQVGVRENKIVFQHYRKPCASFFVAHADSAMPYRTKYITLVQEVVRTIRNTSRNLPEEVRNNALSELSFRMKESGYNAAVRYKVLQDGVKTFEKQLQRDQNGECPLYRPKGYQQEARRCKKALSKVAWYRPHNSVLFIPPTPGSTLKKQMMEVATELEEGSGMKIRIVERAGIKLQHLLPGHKNQSECTAGDCFLHTSGGKGSHESEGIVYRGDCTTCLQNGPSSKPSIDGEIEEVRERKPGTKSVYVGESGRSMYVRGKEHLSAIESSQRAPKPENTNAFARHAHEYHAGETPQFKISVLKSYPKSLERQICEGVHIRKQEKEADILMNSKLDHFAPAVGRVIISNSVNN